MSEPRSSGLAPCLVVSVLVWAAYVAQQRQGTRSALRFAATAGPKPTGTLEEHEGSVFWRNYVLNTSNYPDTTYEVPMCDTQNATKTDTPTCHESPGIPTPRTPYSVYYKSQLHAWFAFQAKLKKGADDAQRNGGVDVAFVGDSIFESFRGTSGGVSCEQQRCKGVPAEFKSAFGSLRTITLAISGDQVQHVLWRTIAANEPDRVPGGGEFDTLRPAVVVVLIGTNNLAAGMAPATVAAGVYKLVLALKRHSLATEIVAVPLLPRWANHGDVNMPAHVAEVNRQLRQLLSPKIIHEDTPTTTVTISACGHTLASKDSQRRPEPDWIVDRQLMPDGLHPGAAGARVWLDCLSNEVKQAVARVRASGTA
eukprot:m.78140 g.78140  ORF g.78140 m.78140 type:complete len:367 (-) comp9199_c0_seq1:1248-2348(-)